MARLPSLAGRSSVRSVCSRLKPVPALLVVLLVACATLGPVAVVVLLARAFEALAR